MEPLHVTSQSPFWCTLTQCTLPMLLKHSKFQKNILKGGTLKRSKQDENLDSNLEVDSKENEMSESDNESDVDEMTDDDITKGRYCYCT